MRAKHRRAWPARALLLVAAASAAGCSAIGFGGPVLPLAGPWSGTLNIDGQNISASLVLRGEEDLEGLLMAPALRLEATGDGSADDRGFTLTLGYDLRCPGTLRLEGIAEPGPRLAGQLAATDCTGTVRGTFSFRPGQP